MKQEIVVARGKLNGWDSFETVNEAVFYCHVCNFLKP